jgi:hypothetical protein
MTIPMRSCGRTGIVKRHVDPWKYAGRSIFSNDRKEVRFVANAADACYPISKLICLHLLSLLRDMPNPPHHSSRVQPFGYLHVAQTGPSGPIASGQNEDSSRACGELRSRGRRCRSPRRNLDFRGFEDPNENFVQFINSVFAHPCILDRFQALGDKTLYVGVYLNFVKILFDFKQTERFELAWIRPEIGL